MPSRLQVLKHGSTACRVGPQIVLGLQNAQAPWRQCMQAIRRPIVLLAKNLVLGVLSQRRQPVGEPLGQIGQTFSAGLAGLKSADAARARVVTHQRLNSWVPKSRRHGRFAATGVPDDSDLGGQQCLLQGCDVA